MTAATFRKKPVTVEAIQWTGDNLAEIQAFLGEDMADPKPNASNGVWVFTPEGMIGYGIGYWLIRGVQGEHYGCMAEVFAQTYEPVPAEQSGEASQ